MFTMDDVENGPGSFGGARPKTSVQQAPDPATRDDILTSLYGTPANQDPAIAELNRSYSAVDRKQKSRKWKHLCNLGPALWTPDEDFTRSMGYEEEPFQPFPISKKITENPNQSLEGSTSKTPSLGNPLLATRRSIDVGAWGRSGLSNVDDKPVLHSGSRPTPSSGCAKEIDVPIGDTTLSQHDTFKPPSVANMNPRRVPGHTTSRTSSSLAKSFVGPTNAVESPDFPVPATAWSDAGRPVSIPKRESNKWSGFSFKADKPVLPSDEAQAPRGGYVKGSLHVVSDTKIMQQLPTQRRSNIKQTRQEVVDKNSAHAIHVDDGDRGSESAFLDTKHEEKMTDLPFKEGIGVADLDWTVVNQQQRRSKQSRLSSSVAECQKISKPNADRQQISNPAKSPQVGTNNRADEKRATTADKKPLSLAEFNKQKSYDLFDIMKVKHKNFFSKRSLHGQDVASPNELSDLLDYIQYAETGPDNDYFRNLFLMRLMNTKFMEFGGPVFTFVTNLLTKNLPGSDSMNGIEKRYGTTMEAMLKLLDELLFRIPHVVSTVRCVVTIFTLVQKIPNIRRARFCGNLCSIERGLRDPHLLVNKVNDPTHNWSHDLSFVGEKTMPPIDIIISGPLPRKFTNLIDRGYGNAKKYIEIWYRLMREDFLSPTRTAVLQFKALTAREKTMHTRVDEGFLYQFSKKIQTKRINNQLLLRLDFREFNAERLSEVDWSLTNRLRSDSLLLLTTNDFEAVVYVIVHHIDNERKSDGLVWVRLIEHVDVKFDKEIQGLEPTPFWEPYRCVLDRLKEQAANIEDGHQLPLEKYLVNLDSDVRYPTYLEQGERLLTREGELITLGMGDAFSVLNLDESQQTALELAFTHELAVIQGPPGTGKSYVGAHLVDILLLNKRLWQHYDSGCILMMSFTNHAIDQFVKECEKMDIDMEKTVRVGSRSDASMQKYLLRNRWNDMCKKIEYKGMQRLSYNIRNEIQAYDMAISSAERAISDDLTKVPFEYYSDSISASCWHDFVHAFGDVRHVRILEWLAVDKNPKRYLQNVTPFTNRESNQVHDVMHINHKKRARLFAYWCQAARNQAEPFLIEAVQRRAELQIKLDEQRRAESVAVVRSANIIAMTTTGASKHAHLLEAVQPTIVIVEEAAEVLESHIVAPLTAGCKHLILIGDHQQLRPTISEYRLIKEHRNLDVSLFERLVRNNFPNTCLKVQHRMHPDISRILYPHIYKELVDHPDVLKYPEVRGMKKRMTLVEHNEPESKIGENSSYTNRHEAEFLVAICRYLLQQGYTPSEITILATYTGQKRLIEHLMTTAIVQEEDMNDAQVQLEAVGMEEINLRDSPDAPKCQKSFLSNVRVTTVDNYQGEENKIILLSFVRSNQDEKIGFLQWSNRVCVALSRAKHGFYALGNFRLYASKSDIWKKLREQLTSDSGLSGMLELRCERHGTVTPVTYAQNFYTSAPEGGCAKVCEHRLTCGHACKRLCHPDDSEHTIYECPVPCPGQLSCDHACNKQCYVLGDDQNFEEMEKCSESPADLRMCSSCSKRVICRCHVIVHPACGHVGSTSCSHLKTFLCETMVPKTLTCGHDAWAECCKDIMQIKCKEIILDVLDCGHAIRRDCFKKSFPCTELVPKTLKCNHTIEVECGQFDTEVPCRVTVTLTLPCEHKLKTCCYQSKYRHKCLVQVEIPKKCGDHLKKVFCCDKDEPDKEVCRIRVERYFDNCKHSIKQECHQPMPKRCIAHEKVRRKCGHMFSCPCYEVDEVTAKPCTVNVRKYRPCSHYQNVPCNGSKNELKGSCWKDCYRRCSHGTPCQKLLENGKLQSKGRSKRGSTDRRHLCKDPCPPCTRPCPIGCIHKTCSRLCHEECNRNPCDERCTENLKCGHPCQGLCGEPCPKYCPDCLKKKGGIHSAKVSVQPCNHYSDVGPLDYHMKIEENECVQVLKPRYCMKGCGCLIENCPRYGNYIKRYLKLLKNQDYKDDRHWLYCKRGACIFSVPRKYKKDPENPDKQIELPLLLPKSHHCAASRKVLKQQVPEIEEDIEETEEKEQDDLEDVEFVIKPTNSVSVKNNIYMRNVAKHLRENNSKFNEDAFEK